MVYEKEYNDGKFVKTVKLIYPDGDFYTGDFSKEDYMEGTGTYTWIKEKQVYTGLFVKNQKSGKGKTTYDNGDVLEGIWTADTLLKQTRFTPKQAAVAAQNTPTQVLSFNLYKITLVSESYGAMSSIMDKGGTITISQSTIEINYASGETQNETYLINDRAVQDGASIYFCYNKLFLSGNPLHYVLKLDAAKKRFLVSRYRPDEYNYKTQGVSDTYNWVTRNSYDLTR